MKILYLNLCGVVGEAGRAVRSCGHNLVLRSACVDALEALRDDTFEAVVIEDGNQDAAILHFTVQVHESHPALPIFVANTWRRGLLRAIEQFGHTGNCYADDTDFSPMAQVNSVPYAADL